jgi:uncharacterized membrane protein YdbT with pleckstrin-like domain
MSLPDPNHPNDRSQPDPSDDGIQSPESSSPRDDGPTQLRPPAQSLLPTQTKEETLWVGRASWKHHATTVIIFAVVGLLAIVLALAFQPAVTGWVFLLTLAIGVIIGGRILVAIYSTRYELTNERLFIERGLLNITKDQTELIRVDDVRVRKLLVDRIFNLGSIDVLSTDLSDKNLTIEGVAGADDVAEMIRSNMRAARKKSLFIESL